ncbi:hypothetical protein A4X06_0g7723, partial [Tilletia controversa]
MAPNRVALNPQHDFEAVDAAQARCLICANAPEMDIRKVDKHRITAAHLRNLKLEPRRLCVTSVLHQRFRDSRAVGPAAAAGALAEDRDVGPFHFDTPFNASDRPLVVDNANVLVKDNIRPAVILPSLATRSFDRDWNAMPDAGDRGREIPGWQFRESNLEEEAYFQAVQAALAAVPRTDEDGAFFPWPNRSTFLLSLVAFAPRCPLSRSCIEMILAFARAIAGYDIPSMSAFRQACEKVRGSSGAGWGNITRGSAGTPIFSKSLKSGLTKDFGDPNIRGRFHFYPRKGDAVCELRDGLAYHTSEDRQPMVVLNDGSHAYLHEPLALRNNCAVLPELWYTDSNENVRGRGPRLQIFAGPRARAMIDSEAIEDFSIDSIATCTMLSEQLRHISVDDLHGNTMRTMHPLRQLANGKKVRSVPVLMWEDDWRGTMGVGNYPHTSILFSNALLDRQDLDRRSSAVRFFSASAIADPEELLEAFSDEMNLLRSHPFFVWDCVDNDLVLIYPWLIAATGDSVMLAKLASSVGAQGNRPCRMCDWGGNELFKHSAEGVRAAMKSGEVRETAKVIEELKAQLQLAVDDKAPALQERWTATGTKDSATTEACTILLEENDKLKGKVARAPGQPRERLSSQDVQARLQTLREALTAKHWHSSLHQIVGFGGPEYTAIDILHVASLGPGKYLAALTASSLDVSALDHLRVRLEALSTTAIMDASSYPA